MAQLHTIKRRIRSVKNINQITKAMEMVAASKLRRAQERALRSRLYATSAREALAHLRTLSRETDLDLFVQRKIKHRLIIVFTSDRGLAGAYNNNVFKVLANALGQTVSGIKLIVVGQKGAQFISRLDTQAEIIGAYTSWPASPAPANVQPIASSALDLFRRGTVDQVTLIYTDFVSVVKQAVIERDILPIDPASILPPASARPQLPPDTLFEPSPARVLRYIIPRFLETLIYQASLEAAASEQAMRMMAMRNASDNASDLTSDLTLAYNGARQAAITQELSEISAGAAAIA